MASRIISGFLLVQLLVTVSGYTSVKYIDSYCGSTIFVSSAVRLKLRSYYWPINNPCTVSFTSSSVWHSDSSTRMLVRFNSINLSGSNLFSCSKSEVDITDSDGTRLNSGGSCGYSLPFSQPWKTSGNTMTVTLKKKSSFTLTGSFDLLVTQFTTGICFSGEFDCFNGRCVDNSLTCDGYNNCGDNSDETSNCGWSIGVTAGVSVVGIVVFVFFILVFAAFYRRRTYGRVFWGSGPYTRNGPTVISSTTSSCAYPPPTHCPPPTNCAPPPAYCNTGYSECH